MTPHRPLPADLERAAFATSAARAMGVGEGRLRGRDLQRPFHGVRVRADGPLLLEQRCRAKLVTMRPGDVFSHATACALYKIPVPRNLLEDRIHVASFHPARIPRGRGVRGHRLKPDGTQVTRWRGLPLVSPEDAWCQLGPTASERDLVVAGDALLGRHDPLSTPDRMRAAVDRYVGRRGHPRLVAAIERVRAGTDSPAESELRLDLVDYGLPEPDVNVVIRDRRGRQMAIGDLVYRRYRVLVEYDGEQHRVDDDQFGRDVDRLDDVMHDGWRVIRFTKKHRGAERRARLERVREALVERGWQP
jgi:hypothetical protein